MNTIGTPHTETIVSLTGAVICFVLLVGYLVAEAIGKNRRKQHRRVLREMDQAVLIGNGATADELAFAGSVLADIDEWCGGAA